jgi:hypothetical protein
VIEEYFVAISLPFQFRKKRTENKYNNNPLMIYLKHTVKIIDDFNNSLAYNPEITSILI